MSKSFRDFLKELDPTPASPGKTARAFRKNFGFTLKDVEDITNIKEANLSALENEKIEMTSFYAEKLAALFGVHPSVILYPTGWRRVNEELATISTRAQERIKKINFG